MNKKEENNLPESYEAWEQLRKLDYKAYIRKYKAFMAQSTNYRKCSKCPENKAWDDTRTLPCGQFHCWVQ